MNLNLNFFLSVKLLDVINVHSDRKSLKYVTFILFSFKIDANYQLF